MTSLGRALREVFADTIDRLAMIGLITADDAGIRLTEAGLPVADAVAAEFLDM